MTRAAIHDVIAVPFSSTERARTASLLHVDAHAPTVARVRGSTSEAVRRAIDARVVYGPDDGRAQVAAIECAAVAESHLAALIADCQRDGLTDPAQIAGRLTRLGVRVRP